MLSGFLGAILVFLVALAAFHMIGPRTGKIADSVRSTEAELESDVAAVFSMLPADLDGLKSQALSLGSRESPTETCSAAQTPDWVDERMRVLDEL